MASLKLPKYLFSLLLLLNGLSVSAADSEFGRVIHANGKNPGSAIDLSAILSKDADTLLFIHSPHCGPCKRIEPKIKKLAKAKHDLKIVDVLLDSKNDDGIGFDSEAARQFDIHSVPEFRIYDRKGELVERGDPADDKVDDWLVQYKIKKKDQ